MKTESKIEEFLKDSEESIITSTLKKDFGITVEKVIEKREITFHIKNKLNEGKWDEFDLIDDIVRYLKKSFSNSVVEFEDNKFTVKEL